MSNVQSESIAAARPVWARAADLSIRTKILSVVVVLVLVAGVGITIAIGAILGMVAGADRLEHLHNDVSANLASLHVNQMKSRMITAQIASVTTPAVVESWMDQQTANDAEIATALDAFAATEGAQLPAWEPFTTDLAEWMTFRDAALIPSALDNAAGTYEATLMEESIPLIDAFVADLDALEGQVADQTTAQTDQAHTASSAAIRNIIVAVAIGLLIAGGLALVVANAIRRDITRVQASLEALSTGDLTVHAEVTSGDEIGRMAAALSTAQASLRATLTRVGETAQTVATAADELSAANTQVAAGAEEASAQAGVVAAASEQVSRNVQTVAAGAEQMGASIREIAQNANDAARVASKATAVVAATNDTVTKLGLSSQEIGNVVKAIASIAEQTNLLALNATIEAARAGEAGKGFAVVASEVKELARETARATEEITRRVEAIQTETAGAVDAIGEVSGIIASINDYQTTIAAAVEEQTATTNEMSRSVTEAATGSGEIAENISGVAAGAAASSETVLQMGSSVAELARLSTSLRTELAAFTY